ncbi:MAG: TIGR02611 family protein [Tetrasphaera sp.]
MSPRQPDDVDRNEIGRHDHNILLDQYDDDWAWRRKLRSNPTTARLYRLAVGALGTVIVVGGLLLVPLPGPGWLIVFAGLAVWASEFEWAQRLLDWVRAKVRAWNDWIRAQARWLQALAAVVTAAFVVAVIWAVLRVSGVPGFFPDGLESFLHANLGL